MNPRSRVFQVAVGLVVVGVLVVFWLVIFPSDSSPPSESSVASNSDPSHPPEVVFPVEVSIARRGDLVKRLSTSGIIRAKREVDLVARISGEIVSLHVSNGTYVKQGDLLVKLDDREYRLAFEKAKAALLSAQIEYKWLTGAEVVGTVDSMQLAARIIEAKAKLQHAAEQYQQGELSKEEFTRLKRDYEADIAYYSAERGDLVANKSGLTQAQEMYERAKMNLEWTEIRAPFSGYVANCEIGEHMQVQTGQVLFKLIDVSNFLVDVEVLESEIAKITVGRKAELSVNTYPDERFTGTVAAVNPVVDPKSKTVKVTVELKDARPKQKEASGIAMHGSTLLRPGMFAVVKLEAEILKNRLLVPKQALLLRDQRALVFVAQDGLAKWHYVEVGEENEEFIEIRSGIAVGDTVIVDGHYTLAHDARIRIGEKAK